MASFDSIWNIALGVLSIIIVAVQLVHKLLKKKLPSKRLRRMLQLLEEAEALLSSCSEEGLVHGEKAESFRRNLVRYVASSLCAWLATVIAHVTPATPDFASLRRLFV